MAKDFSVKHKLYFGDAKHTLPNVGDRSVCSGSSEYVCIKLLTSSMM